MSLICNRIFLSTLLRVFLPFSIIIHTFGLFTEVHFCLLSGRRWFLSSSHLILDYSECRIDNKNLHIVLLIFIIPVSTYSLDYKANRYRTRQELWLRPLKQTTLIHNEANAIAGTQTSLDPASITFTHWFAPITKLKITIYATWLPKNSKFLTLHAIIILKMSFNFKSQNHSILRPTNNVTRINICKVEHTFQLTTYSIVTHWQ